MSYTRVYDFHEMAVGDVLDIPQKPEYASRVGGADPLYSAVSWFGKRNGKKFTIQKMVVQEKVVFRVKRIRVPREK